MAAKGGIVLLLFGAALSSSLAEVQIKCGRRTVDRQYTDDGQCCRMMDGRYLNPCPASTQCKATTARSTLCVQPPTPTNAEVECEDNGTEFVCTAKCLPGFTLLSPSNATTEKKVCDKATAFWADGDIFQGCLLGTSTYCRPLRAPLHGLVQCENKNSELVCTAVCGTDYVFTNGKSVIQRRCEENNGTWPEGTRFPFCIHKNITLMCHPIPDPDHGFVNCVADDDKLLCTALCKDGYRFSTGDYTVQRECDHNSNSWHGGNTIPDCVPVTTVSTLLCPTLPDPNHGSITCVADDNNLLCTATCDPGYKFDSGAYTIQKQCNEGSSQWTGGINFPACIPADANNATTLSCQSLKEPEHGSINCLADDNQLLCTASCDEGYKFDTGDYTVQKECDPGSNVWIGGADIPACIIKSCDVRLLQDVPNSQWTASSEWQGVRGYHFGPTRGRLNATAESSGGLVLSGGWRPATNTFDQYLQVKLNNLSRIEGIVTKGRNVISGDTANEFVTRFRVLHSTDGANWQPYGDATVSDKFLDGNSDRDSEVTNVFTCPFNALYIRVNPLSWNEHIALRFDVVGCTATGAANTCEHTTTTTHISTTITTTTTQAPTTTTTTMPTTVTTMMKTATTPPKSTAIQPVPTNLCYSIPPPTNGIVQCEEQEEKFVCVGRCRDGFVFDTKDALLKRVCIKSTGYWQTGEHFPSCIASVGPTPSTHTFISGCVSKDVDCANVGNGDFQACGNCHYFATCSETFLYVRACPEDLLFDNQKQRCDYKSSTCMTQSVQPIG